MASLESGTHDRPLHHRPDQTRPADARRVHDPATFPLDHCRRAALRDALHLHQQLRHHDHEPDGDHNHLCAGLQHAVGAGRHAVFWPCGLCRCGRVCLHAYHQLGWVLFRVALARSAHLWRADGYGVGHHRGQLFDAQGWHRLCHDQPWRGRVDCRLFRHHRGVFRRRRRHFGRPHLRLAVLWRRVPATDRGLLPHHLLAHALGDPDVPLFPHALGPHGQCGARQSRTGRVSGLFRALGPLLQLCRLGLFCWDRRRALCHQL
mmetsp:Transcript_22697/g.37367  ORF Transcript_22697/g.37367 Transcript_22697/m.37367 type:complete len:262 (+) Transcript_22697:1158-1943(+)